MSPTSSGVSWMFEGEHTVGLVFRLIPVRFVTATHTHTMMGKALYSAGVSARINDRFQEPLYLFLELLRAGVVHGGKWGGPDAETLSGGPSFGGEEEMAHTLLIMRVLSIVPLSFRVRSACVFDVLS